MGDGTHGFGPAAVRRSSAGWFAALGVIVAVAFGVLGVVATGTSTIRTPSLDEDVDRCGPAWVTAWQTSPQAVPPAEPLAGRTIRMIVQPQASGRQLRVRLSNRFGIMPLPVGPVSAARAGAGAALIPGTARPVTFRGRPEAVVAPGAELVSDPVPVAAEAGRPVAVSLVLPRTPEVVAEHPVALQTSYLSDSAHDVLDDDGAAFTTSFGSWMVLSGLDVLTPRPLNAVVAMGDSITDGVGSGSDTDTRWSDALSDRLARRGNGAAMAVLNAGISRNELLADRADGGDSPLARLRSEVLDLSGATDVVLHVGTNDIAAGRSAPEIVDGLARFSAAARTAGRRVFLTTITPSDAGDHGTRRARAVRDEVNRWVRERGAVHADGVFDFAVAVADPDDPARLLTRYDAGDGLHLSEAGYRALADAVDVTRLTGSPCLADRNPASVALADG